MKGVEFKEKIYGKRMLHKGKTKGKNLLPRITKNIREEKS